MHTGMAVSQSRCMQRMLFWITCGRVSFSFSFDLWRRWWCCCCGFSCHCRMWLIQTVDGWLVSHLIENHWRWFSSRWAILMRCSKPPSARSPSFILWVKNVRGLTNESNASKVKRNARKNTHNKRWRRKDQTTKEAHMEREKRNHITGTRCDFMKLITVFNCCRHFLDNNNNIQIDCVRITRIECGWQKKNRLKKREKKLLSR